MMIIEGGVTRDLKHGYVVTQLRKEHFPIYKAKLARCFIKQNAIFMQPKRQGIGKPRISVLSSKPQGRTTPPHNHFHLCRSSSIKYVQLLVRVSRHSSLSGASSARVAPFEIICSPPQTRRPAP